MKEKKYVAYVGTYTHGNSKGIYIYDLDVENGRAIERKVVPINNPSYIKKSHNGKYLYSISDEGVRSFKILPDGDLEPMNSASICGMRGCYLSTDKLDRYLFVGGWHDGKVTVMRLNEDGTIANIDVSKSITLADYENLVVPMSEVQATDEEVDSDINSTLSANQEVSDDTSLEVADGDKVNIDYVGTIDGEEFEGGSATG